MQNAPFSTASSLEKNLKYFTILGERCSGTNLLRMMLSTNFELEYTSAFHHKHFFGHCDYLQDRELAESTLFVCVVRNVYEWLLSLYEKQHHMEKTNSFSEFLSRRVRSVDESDGSEIVEDRNWETGDYFSNILELRSVKLRFLKESMPHLVSNYCFVLYENISSSALQLNFLEKLSRQFPVKPRLQAFTPIAFHAQVYDHTNTKRIFTPKKYYIKDIEDLKFIESRLNSTLEKAAGYDLGFYRHKIDLHKRMFERVPDSQAEMIKRRNKSLLDVRIISRLIEASKEQERKDAEGTAHVTAKNQEGPAAGCATFREDDFQENGNHGAGVNGNHGAGVNGPRLIASHTNGNAARTQVGYNIRKKNLVTMKKKK